MIDRVWSALTQSLPVELRAAAETLPTQLGLGPRWGGFVRLRPNRELPLYAAEGLAVADLAAYRRAHWLGGFTGLIADRLADGQVELTRERLRLAQAVSGEWRRALGEACGDERAQLAVAEARSAWRRGVRSERALLGAATQLAVSDYVAMVRARLRWIGVSARCLLAAHAAPERARAFSRAHDRLLLSLQLLDDGADGEEDAARLGRGVSQAMGVPPSGLARASARLAAAAADEAERSGFTQLARFCRRRARSIDKAMGSPGVLDGLAGLAVAEAALAALDAGAAA